jgi:peptide/nickel transport system permease protein
MVVGLVLIAFWLIVVVVSFWWTPQDPLAQTSAILAPPSAQHPFGTDELGRDVLSRVLAGARISLPLGVLLVVMELLIGGSLGALAGYFGGWIDDVIMRVADLVFAFPTILLAMVVVAALGPGLLHAVIAVAAVAWPTQARVVRSLVRTAMQSEYVAVTRLLGASALRALVVDVVRNVVGPVLVLATLGVGTAILLLAGLSFLGLGARPPAAEWGSMISSGATNFQAWWLGTFPGIAILTVVLAFNFLGDGLRDAFDPRSLSDETLAPGRALDGP